MRRCSGLYGSPGGDAEPRLRAFKSAVGNRCFFRLPLNLFGENGPDRKNVRKEILRLSQRGSAAFVFVRFSSAENISSTALDNSCPFSERSLDRVGRQKHLSQGVIKPAVVWAVVCLRTRKNLSRQRTFGCVGFLCRD